MKTLLFTLEFPPFKGGVANYYGNLAKHWPLGEDLLILNNNKGELTRPRKFLNWWPAIGMLRRKIKNAKINYVLVGQILPLGTVAWLLSFFCPFKYAVFLHGMDFTYALKTPRKKWLAGEILKRADKIIGANSYVVKTAREIFPGVKGKIAVVNPGIAGDTPPINPADLAKLENNYGLAGKTVFLSLGRLVKRKGTDQTIAALAQIPEALLADLVYFIAGDGPEETYLRRLVPSPLEKKIIFLGELSEDEKWLWLARTEVLIMPSRNIEGDFEGFGIVYLEANISGKPVIAGDSGGVRDAVIDGHNGILVDPEDINSVKEAIIRLAGDAALRKKLGVQGRDRARREFSWEKQTAKLVNFIKN